VGPPPQSPAVHRLRPVHEAARLMASTSTGEETR
jgi:hypothetical protein